MKIFDSHAHYDSEMYENDLYEVIDNCYKENVDKICLISASVEDSILEKNLSKELNEKYKSKINFYYTLGVHPDDIVFSDSDSELKGAAKKSFDELVSILDDSLKNDKNNIVAIGEIGLDYYRKEKTESLLYNQKEWFRQQLYLAKSKNLPVVIHSRDACEDTYEMLKSSLDGNKGILHCYSYTVESVKNFLKMDLYIGIGGVVTFKNGQKLKEVVDYLPLDRIVVETDCPYLSPTPFRGERNDSSKIKYVLSEISKIKNIDIEELSEIVYNNACKVYNIK